MEWNWNPEPAVYSSAAATVFITFSNYVIGIARKDHKNYLLPDTSTYSSSLELLPSHQKVAIQIGSHWPRSMRLIYLILSTVSFSLIFSQLSSALTMPNLSKVRAVSFDVTGTILVHRYPIMDTYAASAIWAKLPNPPTSAELKPAFKKAYYKHLTESPCFGGKEGLSSRQWWVRTVRSALEYCGRTDYTQEEFDRFFRRVYQHYGSLEGYEKLPDAIPFLDWLKDQKKYSLGVTTNTPVRTVETVLPMNGFHEYFQWFLCSQDIGFEKPSKEIFDRTYERALFWTPDLKREEILHIGDSMEADFCGAKAAGFQALLLDRSDNPRVTVYQDWLEAPSYPGKSEGDIALGTVKNLLSIIPLLEDSTARFG